ncbi:hypothetical protein QLF84_23880, partial [Salmonella enterica subsp. enterica serovar Oslo]
FYRFISNYFIFRISGRLVQSQMGSLMNVDNPSQRRPLAASWRQGPLLSGWQAKKTAGSPAVKALMVLFVFLL